MIIFYSNYWSFVNFSHFYALFCLCGHCLHVWLNIIYLFTNHNNNAILSYFNITFQILNLNWIECHHCNFEVQKPFAKQSKAMSFCAVVSILTLITIANSQSCATTQLVLDESHTDICDIPCNQCLKYIHINLDHLTMNTSTSISSIISPSESSCKCPSFTITLHQDNYYHIFHSSQISSLGTINPSLDHIKIQFNSWLLTNPCIQYYIPNTNNFMSVQSYSGLVSIIVPENRYNSIWYSI